MSRQLRHIDNPGSWLVFLVILGGVAYLTRDMLRQLKW